jgi:hypothetical protein
MFTGKNERETRIAACNSCSNKNGVRCAVCGCFLLGLQKIKMYNCPLNKW